jgi:hypothetical protein
MNYHSIFSINILELMKHRSYISHRLTDWVYRIAKISKESSPLIKLIGFCNC